MPHLRVNLPEHAVLLCVGAAAMACGAAGDNLARLLRGWRAAGLPVIHADTQPFPADGAAADLLPTPGETVLTFRRGRSFFGKSLRARLRSEGLQCLVIAGAETQGPVQSAVRTAACFGFDVYLVADACLAGDVGLPGGRTVPARDVQALTLATLDGREATVVLAETALFAVRPTVTEGVRSGRYGLANGRQLVAR